jgi:hypothetical protein
MLADDVSYVEVEVTRLDPGPPTKGSFATTPITSSATTSAPPQLACVIRKRSNIATRSGRGRIFFGPLADTMWNGAAGTFDVNLPPTLAARTNTYLRQLTGPAAALYGAMVLYNRTTGATIEVDSFNGSTRPGTMRSRVE